MIFISMKNSNEVNHRVPILLTQLYTAATAWMPPCSARHKESQAGRPISELFERGREAFPSRKRRVPQQKRKRSPAEKEGFPSRKGSVPQQKGKRSPAEGEAFPSRKGSVPQQKGKNSPAERKGWVPTALHRTWQASHGPINNTYLKEFWRVVRNSA